jgi:hypothetical protein
MKPILSLLVALGLALAVGGQAAASAESDAFGKCLVESSTGKDRVIVMQWFFAALSVNPNVESFSSATPDLRASVTKQAAMVLERLVLVDCRAEAVAAIKHDGPQALETSFEVFGRSAAAELMADPAVTKQMNSISLYTDNNKWAALVDEAKK